MKKEKKIIYYKDELNDDFSRADIKVKKIDGNYTYVAKNPFKKFAEWFLYRIVAIPLSFLFLKFFYGHKIVNKKVIKKQKGAYFTYANHTNAAADPFIPTFVSFPKRVHVIVGAANVSIKGIGGVIAMLGALPLPDDVAATKNFTAAINLRVKQNRAICVYPEAHIWPYYTGIRPFKDTSFRYPVHSGVPVFCFTNTYKKRKFFKRPKIVTYIDGPFYPDASCDVKTARAKLRDEVYFAMVERSKNSDAEYIKYVRAESSVADER